MGVTYKLKNEVVSFIISHRQGNPLSSCRQLAEAASEKFGLNLSKSSVHDVLKESGIITPRGRKPKPKFTIPQEKKRQIQTSLSQVKLLPSPINAQPDPRDAIKPTPVIKENKPVDSEVELSPSVTSPEYSGAGKIFLKAALWDLGIYPKEGEGEELPKLQEVDWAYFLTYSKGVNLYLENDRSVFIEMVSPIERCIREIADRLINNVKPFIVNKVSDEALFKASMEAQEGFKINKISIVEQKDHVIIEFNNIMEYKRRFLFNNMIFMENYEKDFLKRAKAIFLTQTFDNNDVIDSIMNLKGFDTSSKDENNVNLLIDDSYANKAILEQAAERLNGMYLRDEKDRLVKVKVQSS